METIKGITDNSGNKARCSLRQSSEFRMRNTYIRFLHMSFHLFSDSSLNLFIHIWPSLNFHSHIFINHKQTEGPHMLIHIYGVTFLQNTHGYSLCGNMYTKIPAELHKYTHKCIHKKSCISICLTVFWLRKVSSVLYGIVTMTEILAEMWPDSKWFITLIASTLIAEVIQRQSFGKTWDSIRRGNKNLVDSLREEPRVCTVSSGLPQNFLQVSTGNPFFVVSTSLSICSFHWTVSFLWHPGS